MADRLTDLVVGLQRMAEGARLRGDDLRYTQQQETYEHVEWLDRLLDMVTKVRSVLLEERHKFVPAEADRNRQLQQENTAAYVHQLQQKPKQGPKEAAG